MLAVKCVTENVLSIDNTLDPCHFQELPEMNRQEMGYQEHIFTLRHLSGTVGSTSGSDVVCLEDPP